MKLPKDQLFGHHATCPSKKHQPWKVDPVGTCEMCGGHISASTRAAHGERQHTLDCPGRMTGRWCHSFNGYCDACGGYDKGNDMSLKYAPLKTAGRLSPEEEAKAEQEDKQEKRAGKKLEGKNVPTSKVLGHTPHCPGGARGQWSNDSKGICDDCGGYDEECDLSLSDDCDACDEAVKSKKPTGKKFDAGKTMHSLFPNGPFKEIVKVLYYGAFQKPQPDGTCGYGRDNWRDLADGKERYFNAAKRHLDSSFYDGETFDPETGEHKLRHLAQAATCCVFALGLELAEEMKARKMYVARTAETIIESLRKP